jgi:carbon monoxide dehydrogenase subunit G
MAMELDNSFTVPVPPDQAWDVLLDVQRIAPCMPGATVDEVDGDVVSGRIKVKVGPVSLTYRGTAKFTERDPDARMVVVEASGKETRGSGTASATVRASLAPEPSGDGTQVTMHTTMNVTGRPAQFGRGVIVEVGGKLVDQFAQNLAHLIAGDTAAGPDGGAGSGPGAATGASAASVDGADVLAGGDTAEEGAGVPRAAGAETAGPVSTTTAPPPAASDEESLNLVKLVGPAILKRALPVIAAVAIALLTLQLWRLRRRRAGEG